MAFRRRKFEFEADLYRVPMPRFFRRELGELECTGYDDGEERLKITFGGLKVAEGSTAQVVIDGAVIAELTVNRGRARRVLESSKGDAIPEVKTGQEVEIRVLGQALLAGVFKPD